MLAFNSPKSSHGKTVRSSIKIFVKYKPSVPSIMTLLKPFGNLAINQYCRNSISINICVTSARDSVFTLMDNLLKKSRTRADMTAHLPVVLMKSVCILATVLVVLAPVRLRECPKPTQMIK